jgi:hypothetical protein
MGLDRRSPEGAKRRREKQRAKLAEKWRVRREAATDSLSTGSRDNHISKDRDLVGNEN